MATKNDGYGRMLHVTRYEGQFRTEARADGYYFQRLNGPWVGPFDTRDAARIAESKAA